VQAGFARLAQEKALLDPGLRRFLSRAYAYKTIADYETGAAAPISGAMAEAAVAEARRFVAAVEALVAAGGGGEAAPPPG
jgi:uncharacterized protein (UPF0332 family)